MQEMIWENRGNGKEVLVYADTHETIYERIERLLIEYEEPCDEVLLETLVDEYDEFDSLD